MTNKHKVPKKQWNKWTPGAKAMFNYLYAELRESWDVILPDSLSSTALTARKVAAWNIAWVAADAAQEQQAA